jgi:hypothetical protein
MPPLLLTFLFACNKDEEITYELFNAEGDAVEVAVGSPEVLDPVETVILSSTGEVEIGWAEVDPGGGPLDTEYSVVVIVFDDYQDLVDRVSIRTRSPGRGVDEYDLRQDSADEGYYKERFETNGVAGEFRTDTLTFRLWDAAAVEEE